MDWKKGLPLLLCGVIVAIGLIISANTLAMRPMQGHLNASISTGGYPYPDLMESSLLLDYLGIYPDKPQVNEDGNTLMEPQLNTYEYDRLELIKQLESNILTGVWPDFPYVKIKERMYFSKEAVNEWFAKKGKLQLTIK